MVVVSGSHSAQDWMNEHDRDTNIGTKNDQNQLTVSLTEFPTTSDQTELTNYRPILVV